MISLIHSKEILTQEQWIYDLDLMSKIIIKLIMFLVFITQTMRKQQMQPDMFSEDLQLDYLLVMISYQNHCMEN